jgi:hypothetical protein
MLNSQPAYQLVYKNNSLVFSHFSDSLFQSVWPFFCKKATLILILVLFFQRKEGDSHKNKAQGEVVLY